MAEIVPFKQYEKVTFVLSNTKPVEVSDFLSSVEGFQKEFKKELLLHGIKYNDENYKLYISVKEGSLEWSFFISLAKDIGQKLLFEEAPMFILKKLWLRFAQNFSKIRKGKDTKYNDLQLLENQKDVLKAPAQDTGASLSVKYKSENNGKKEEYEFNATGLESLAVSNIISDKIKEIKKNENANEEFFGEVLELKLSSNDGGKVSLKGFIETYDPDNAFFVHFTDNEMKDRVLLENEDNPLTKNYYVDGIVKIRRGKIMVYEITNIIEAID